MRVGTPDSALPPYRYRSVERAVLKGVRNCAILSLMCETQVRFIAGDEQQKDGRNHINTRGTQDNTRVTARLKEVISRIGNRDGGSIRFPRCILGVTRSLVVSLRTSIQHNKFGRGDAGIVGGSGTFEIEEEQREGRTHGRSFTVAQWQFTWHG